VLGLLSLALLAGLASIVAGARPALASTIASRPSVASGQDVVYGKVTDPKGRPDRHFRVVLYHFAKHRQVLDKVTYTNAAGLYRVVLPARTGWEYVQLNNARNTVRKHVRFAMRPGWAYDVSAHYSMKPYFFYLPFFVY
jgi:hypothetical protein